MKLWTCYLFSFDIKVSYYNSCVMHIAQCKTLCILLMICDFRILLLTLLSTIIVFLFFFILGFSILSPIHVKIYHNLHITKIPLCRGFFSFLSIFFTRFYYTQVTVKAFGPFSPHIRPPFFFLEIMQNLRKKGNNLSKLINEALLIEVCI